MGRIGTGIRQTLPAGIAFLACAAAVCAQTAALTANPTSLSFTYQAGAFPKAVQLTIRIGAGTPSYTVTISNPSAGGPVPLWLTATPDTGKLPANLSVRVNPSEMAAGTYQANVVVAAAGTAGVTVPVTLVVAQPLSNLGLSRTIVPMTAPPAVSTDTVVLSTTAGPVSYTATVAGAPWLSVSPASGYVLPGAPKTLTLSVDASSLAPQKAAYAGKVTIVASGVAAANRSQSIAVNLTVNSTTPAISGALWPNSAQAGSPATTITIRGSAFYSGTTVKMTPQGSSTTTTVTPTVLSSTVMMASIPAALLSAAQRINVVASNPAGDSAAATFTVSSNPVVTGVVNLASYSGTSVSPGELITLFGLSIGPATPASMADADGDGFVDSTLAGVTVTIDGKAAPLLYVSQDQISVQVPYAVSIGAAKVISVNNNGVTALGAVDTALTMPAIFTLDGSGAGQAAAMNVDAAGQYSLNGANSPAKPGDIVLLYITGEGDYAAQAITARTGLLVTSALNPLPQPVVLPVVNIGGAAATVQYAGPFVGSILGIMQINAVVPASAATGTAVPVTVSAGGVSAQSGVTLSIHP